MPLPGHSFMWIHHVLPSMLVSTPTMSKISKSSYLIISSLDATGSRSLFVFSLFEPEDSTTSALDAKIYFKSMSFLESLFHVQVSNLSVLSQGRYPYLVTEWSNYSTLSPLKDVLLLWMPRWWEAHIFHDNLISRPNAYCNR